MTYKVMKHLKDIVHFRTYNTQIDGRNYRELHTKKLEETPQQDDDNVFQHNPICTIKIPIRPIWISRWRSLDDPKN